MKITLNLNPEFHHLLDRVETTEYEEAEPIFKREASTNIQVGTEIHGNILEYAIEILIDCVLKKDNVCAMRKIRNIVGEKLEKMENKGN